MDLGDSIDKAQQWVEKIRNIKDIFTFPEMWLFVNFLGLIILWTLFYFLIQKELHDNDKKNFIALLIFSSVLTFIGLAFYFFQQTVSIIMSIIAFTSIIIAPSYCGWTLIDLKGIKDSFSQKFKGGKDHSNGEVPKIEYQLTQKVLGCAKLKFPRTWFLVSNLGKKPYRAYFKFHFYINGEKIDSIKEGYYGGTKPWNLNPGKIIRASGLVIPQTVIKKYDENKLLEIRIECEIKDEANKVHKWNPVGYIYDTKNESWFLEP